MKFLIRLLLLVLPLVAAAQSRLPPCPPGTETNWNNCFGRTSFPAGPNYLGEYQGGVRHGYGTLIFPNGAMYVGDFRSGKPDGQGIEYLANGAVLRSGRWSEGNLSLAFALDRSQFPFDSRWQAPARQPVQPTAATQSKLPPCPAFGFKHNCFGKSSIFSSDGYEGEWQDGKPDGHGWADYANGEKYAGQFKDGKRNGQGTYTYLGGDNYVGEFRDGMRNGQGTWTKFNGEKYVGEYKNEDFHGRGTYTWSDGQKYVGEFRDGRRNGQGIEYRADGMVFLSGLWANGALTQSFALDENRFPFRGTLHNDGDTGSGALTARLENSSLSPCLSDVVRHACWGSSIFPDGSRYVGEFQNNQWVGLGVTYDSRRNVTQMGLWTAGVLSKRLTLDLSRFPFDNAVPAPIESGKAEENRPALEAEAAQRRRQELEQRLAVDLERERQTAEAEAARRKQQELEQRLATEAEAARLRQKELEQRLTAEARERERQAAEAEVTRRKQQELEQRLATEAREREKQAAEADAARLRQKELEQRLALEAREREKQAAEVEAVRRRQQELEAQLAALQSQSALRPPNPAASTRNQRRVALVIGNAQYKVSPLDNPVNDATDMDRTLKQLGFQTTLLRNATLGQMREATRRFADQLQSADVALIYFAGHGVESNRKNYMIPVNADLKFEYELDDQAYNAGQWLDMLESIKSSNAERVNIVILDACRNNSLIGARSLGRGLGRMDAPTGTFLAYSTAPGKVAADGARGERNSPFTRHLLTVMQQPGLPIEEAFKEVRRNVSRETNGAQVPWESTSLTGFFTFRQTR